MFIIIFFVFIIRTYTSLSSLSPGKPIKVLKRNSSKAVPRKEQLSSKALIFSLQPQPAHKLAQKKDYC